MLDEELLLDESIDDELDENVDEELDEDRTEDELRSDELTPFVVAVNVEILGVPEPFAQKPKLILELVPMVLFHANGDTTLLDARLALHKLEMVAPAVFSVSVQSLTAALPASTSTCAQ